MSWEISGFRKKCFGLLFIMVILTLPAVSGERAAGPLFVESGIIPPISPSACVDHLIIRERWVTVDFNLLCRWEAPAQGKQPDRHPLRPLDRPLPGSIDPHPPSLEINLFEDVHLRALIRRVERTDSGACIYVGEIEDMPGSQVVMVAGSGILQANIAVPGHFYQVRYHGQGVHHIREIDQGRFPSELTPLPGGSAETAIKKPEAAALDSGDIIDIMVVYTAAARSAAGGSAAMENLIDLAVAESNSGYANSGVNQQLRLVYTAEAVYSEVSFNWSTTLSRLRGTSDGYMDEVHAWRNTYGADEVVLIVNNTGYCGIAYVMQTVSTSFAPYAFAVVSRICATGYYSFAHELGHNMGCAHDRANASVMGAYNYAFGYQAPDEAFRTIMAYNCPGGCPRVNYWSNPDKTYGGQPMGVVYTDPLAADNRRALNNTANTVANFRQAVVPAITVTSPDGGEEWPVGSTQEITWTSGGPIDNVKIDYSVNNGENWAGIAASTANDGSYDWTIPDNPSDNCLVRVSETDGSSADVSNGLFSIYVPPPSITVTSPNGGERWPVGSTQEITWTSGGTVGNVKIDYSVDNGENWTEIAASTANDGIFDWPIPSTYDDPPADCLVRVSETDGDPTDVSDGVFALDVQTPTITLTAPDGGETWAVGTVQPITWTSSAVYGNVEIDYSGDNGQNWTVIALSTANNGAFSWVIPDTPSDNCLVRIRERDGSPGDMSGAVFSIVPEQQPAITLLSPNGGESLNEGSIHRITWASTASVGSVNLDYSDDNGQNWHEIAAATENDGSHDWTVPQVSSSLCRVRVQETDGSPSDQSDGVFTIGGPKPFITVVSPNGGEALSVGSVHDIAWTSSGDIGSVWIYYSTNNGVFWKNIVSAAPNNGSHNWEIPDTPSDNCLLRIVAEGPEAGPTDVSDGLFAIVSSAPSITVLSPNGRESLVMGTGHEIKWTSIGTVGDVRIEYSIDSGASWSLVTDSTVNTGSYDWTVPPTPSNHCLVRVSRSDPEGGPGDVSNAEFSIEPPPYNAITVLSPNGGETLYAGLTYEILWSSFGAIDNVKIDYSPDNGDTWLPLAETAENSGHFNWTVPDTPSAFCLVRVGDTGESAADTSDALFAIVLPSTLTLTAPNGGEAWEAGTSRDITWQYSGDIAGVKIDYSLDSGASWINITDSTGNDGYYAWTVPGTPSGLCLMRICQADNDGEPYDVSDEPFAITVSDYAEITVISPDGGELLYAGSTAEIAWTSFQVSGQVAIDYSIDNGQEWTEITPATDNDGSYEWTVPQVSSALCLVRVYETDGLPLDASNGVFEITTGTEPTLTVTAPNGQEEFTVGADHDITWTSTGGIDMVAIDYSVDNGTTWLSIVASTPNSGNFPWTVPDTPSETCLVRLRDAGLDEDIAIKDESDALFTISAQVSPSITVTAPNRGEALIQGAFFQITWTSTGGIEAVILEYSINSGQNWIKIGETANTGAYEWPVPDTPSGHCLVRVSSADSDEGPSDLSDKEFTITAE